MLFRSLEMNKWLEIAFYVIVGVVGTYTTMNSTLTQHTYRLDKIEKDFSDFKDEAAKDRKDIQSMFLDIQVKLAKLQGNKP